MILGMLIDINDTNVYASSDISQTLPLPVSIGIQLSLYSIMFYYLHKFFTSKIFIYCTRKMILSMQIDIISVNVYSP